MKSSLILLLFLLVSFGFGALLGGKVEKGCCGPFFNIRKKPRQFWFSLGSESVVVLLLASESEVLALGEDVSDSKLLGQSSSRTPLGEGSCILISSSNCNDLKS